MRKTAEVNESVIRVGVIGLGVGEQHLIGYNMTENCEVRAICDVDEKHLKAVASRHDVAVTSVDYRTITEDPDIDAVSICSYDDFHVKQAVSAFQNGKHVLLEKPIALFRQDAEILLRAQHDSGKCLTSNLILRQSPRFRSVKNMAEAGEFGEIFAIEGDYIHDILWKITTGWRGKMKFYSTVYGGGIHLIDLMRWILNDEVTEVGGMSNKILTRDSAYRQDDTFFSLLRFSRGAMAKCLSTYGPSRTKFHALNVYGTKKTFLNDMPDAKLFSGDSPTDEERISNDTPGWGYPAVEKGDLIPNFIESIRAGREPNVSSRDVFRVMDICFAAVEAAEKGRNVPVNYLI